MTIMLKPGVWYAMNGDIWSVGTSGSAAHPFSGLRAKDGALVMYDETGMFMPETRPREATDVQFDLVAMHTEAPSPRPTKAETLERATAAVADRGAAYGTVKENFDRIAGLWNQHLINRGVLKDATKALDAHDVAMMNVLMKIARLEQTPSHQDSWVDVAGYAACGNNLPG